jgi:hypothetical protein
VTPYILVKVAWILGSPIAADSFEFIDESWPADVATALLDIQYWRQKQASARHVKQVGRARSPRR